MECLQREQRAVCHNIRIRCCHLLAGEEYRGYNASQRVFFYGYKVHCITAADGAIVEFTFSLGKRDDKIGFSLLNPAGTALTCLKAVISLLIKPIISIDERMNFNQ
ncbi:MAG: transposase [Bacteroidota bacterium]